MLIVDLSWPAITEGVRTNVDRPTTVPTYRFQAVQVDPNRRGRGGTSGAVLIPSPNPRRSPDSLGPSSLARRALLQAQALLVVGHGRSSPRKRAGEIGPTSLKTASVSADPTGLTPDPSQDRATRSCAFTLYSVRSPRRREPSTESQ
jgi:hypothetical protein